MFLSHGSRIVGRWTLLLATLKGDWQNTEEVQVFLLGEGPIDQSKQGQVKANVFEVVEFVFLGRSFLTYPRHRWTGSDVAVSQIAILAVVHGLCKRAALRLGTELQHLHATKHLMQARREEMTDAIRLTDMPHC